MNTDKVRYKPIKKQINYQNLLNSGMFWELYPELSGDWEKDKLVINPPKKATS